MSEEICFASARELARRVRTRELSAREVLQAHLDQIERTNPRVNAIVTLVAERAAEQARAADERLAAGEAPGPLHGLPVAHKDTHATAGIRTTSGSPIFADHVPAEDELVVERIRAAGAVTLGKTNTPEFAAGSHTFNPVFGLTRNPYDPSRSAGGSSGGAAAALACGMHPLADGGDMGGSLRNPASFCNVAGFRPSPGRVPSWPVAAAWSTLGVQGPMAREVADVALLLSVLAGPDPRSPIALETPGSAFAAPLDGDLAGLRVAWSPDLGGTIPVDPAVTGVLEPAVKVFEELGCAVEEAAPDLTGADEVFRTLRAWHWDITLRPLLDERRGEFKEALAANIDAGRPLTGADLGRAETLHTALFHRMREFFGRYDALLLPVSQVPPFDADLEYPEEIAGQRMHDYLEWMRSCFLISATGCPALSVPAGFTSGGLPVGLQIVGPHRADLAVLRIGHAFEQATRHAARRPPVAVG
ncbi:amidase [Actinomadura madurae]|uniref:amidase n=1 Tax=Actinomadura madurae TaxID=1993 RepID=UPI0020D235F6|nr:amidase [Actinomadura madurae]MCP9949646.1 amidase [Actinomadura madurae]MCP9966400.1 amidase [Actinomadura madurae]MCP9978888.1 amidase [Actinomadura madurae]MCQ0009583.1 amidase [Actinomadura madurae]MCQ0015076.1 amidase [Actinomadura madurae]